MSDQVFNDADQFLIRRWGEAKNLSDSMERVRGKYHAKLQLIGESIVTQGRDVDIFQHYTQEWANGCSLVFSCSDWAQYDGGYPDGLWLDYLHLDCLTSEQEYDPYACIWVRGARKASVDVAAAKKTLWGNLPSALNREERTRCADAGKQDQLIGWNFSSKREIVDWLLAGDIESLADCIRGQVTVFSKLMPVLKECVPSTSARK